MNHFRTFACEQGRFIGFILAEDRDRDRSETDIGPIAITIAMPVVLRHLASYIPVHLHCRTSLRA